jgi:hypothetical protein
MGYIKVENPQKRGRKQGSKNKYPLPGSQKLDGTITIRYPSKKLEFLNKIYAERLPDLMRSCMDSLIVDAVKGEEFKITKL